MSDFLNRHLPLILSILYKILIAGGLLAGAWALSKLLVKSLEKGLIKLPHFDDTFLPVSKLLAQYMVYGVAALVILSEFGVNTASIVAFFSVAGLAIGLALRDLLSNVASGLAILLLRPFKNGDGIEAGGVSGSIKEIGLFTTRLQTWSGVYVCVPNNIFWKSPIFNFSRNKKRRFEIEVPLAYFDSLDGAMTAIDALLKEEKRLLPDPAPTVLVKKLNFSSVILEVRGWAKTSEFWDVYWNLTEKLRQSVDAGSIKAPVLRKEIHIQPRE